MLQQNLITAGGIALASALLAFIGAFSFSAWLQKRALVWVGNRFLNVQVSGRVFLACLVGGLLGWGAAVLFSSFDADLIACAAFLLAAWPFLHLWVREHASDEPLSGKSSAILSATSALVSAAIIKLLLWILSALLMAGYLSTLAVLAYSY